MNKIKATYNPAVSEQKKVWYAGLRVKSEYTEAVVLLQDTVIITKSTTKSDIGKTVVVNNTLWTPIELNDDYEEVITQPESITVDLPISVAYFLCAMVGCKPGTSNHLGSQLQGLDKDIRNCTYAIEKVLPEERIVKFGTKGSEFWNNIGQ